MKLTLMITASLERPAGQRYFALARALVQRGHQVRILALHPDLPRCPERRLIRDGVQVWYVGQMHARKSTSVPTRFRPTELLRVLIASTLGMIWGVLCSPADVYQLGKPQPVNGLAALLAVSVLRRRRFYVDCDDDEVASNRLTAAWQRQVFAFWQWLLPGLAAGVSVNTEFLAQRMARRQISPVAYVPNGVDLHRFRRPPAPIMAALRTALGLDGRQVIGYVGTLALQNHPVNLLLDAFAQLAQQLPTVDLLLIGGGEDLELLRANVRQAKLQHRVYFTGQIPQASVPAYLALADLSVDPVEDNVVAQARAPLKIVESMALGIPVVTGAVGDRSRTLDNGRAGLLVAPGSAQALAAGLVALLSDESRRVALAQAAQAHLLGYTWDALAGAWEALYAKATK